MVNIRRGDTHGIAAFAEHGLLQERLTAAFLHVRRKHVAVGLLRAGESSYALVGEDRMSDAFTVRTGCLTKLFTAALARNACRAGWFRLDDPIEDVLGTSAAGAKRNVLAGVTIRHLLEHTHGLDDSMIESASRRADAFIDHERLTAQLSCGRPLAEPGALYSYANVGAWLIAAALERCSGLRYETLLRERLFIRPAIDEQRGGLCPSMGGLLTIRMTDMLGFLRGHALASNQQLPCHDRRGQITPLPGWNALERGVYLGWKYHGQGWFGHNSTWPNASALVRVRPQHGIAFVIASREQPATLVAAKLFGRVFPELLDLRVPPVLDAVQARRLDLHRYVGVYRSAARAVQISRAGGGLQLQSTRVGCGDGGPDGSVNAVLRAAADDVFFVEPAGIDSFAYVQFVPPRADRFEHLWNGRFVLRRVS